MIASVGIGQSVFETNLLYFSGTNGKSLVRYRYRPTAANIMV